MDSTTLLISALSVSLLHTMIPSHWLCFVLVGRTQGWRLRKTMAVAGLAGAAHVLATVGLGIVLAKMGRNFLNPHTIEQISGFLLIGLGGLYLFLHMTHVGHHHEADKSVAQRAALVSLVLAITFSPCSAAIPILITAAANWVQIALIGCVLLVTTVGNMVLMVGLTGLGIEKLQFRFFDKYEKLILGLLLVAFGVIILLGHEHHAH